jgi:hypothetical protein
MHTRTRRGALLAAFAFALLLAGRGVASAQNAAGPTGGGQSSSAGGEVNFEAQLHALVTGVGNEGTEKVPQSLEGVVRQLKAVMPPAEYRLAATFVNRVKNDGSIEMKSAGASPFGPQPAGAVAPTFFQITLSGVKFTDDPSYVRVNPFRFGLRVPVQTATLPGEKGAPAYPVLQYEDVGLTTYISVREGEPTLVGTLNTGRPGQFFILVLTIKRVGK